MSEENNVNYDGEYERMREPGDTRTDEEINDDIINYIAESELKYKVSTIMKKYTNLPINWEDISQSKELDWETINIMLLLTIRAIHAYTNIPDSENAINLKLNKANVLHNVQCRIVIVKLLKDELFEKLIKHYERVGVEIV